MATFKVQMINRHRLTTDGVGVTSLVALAGCPLSCKYCINMDMLNQARVVNYTPEQLWEKLSIDYCYFVASNGGVTFGGGEPLLQVDAILEFLAILPERVAVNIETSMNVNLDKEKLRRLMAYGITFIIDIKSMDEEVYEAYTGMSNTQVLKNLTYIEEHNYQMHCRIRIPRIPNYPSEQYEEEAQKKILSDRGFTNIEMFDYVIRDYM